MNMHSVNLGPCTLKDSLGIFCFPQNVAMSHKQFAPLLPCERYHLGVAAGYADDHFVQQFPTINSSDVPDLQKEQAIPAEAAEPHIFNQHHHPCMAHPLRIFAFFDNSGVMLNE